LINDRQWFEEFRYPASGVAFKPEISGKVQWSYLLLKKILFRVISIPDFFILVAVFRSPLMVISVHLRLNLTIPHHWIIKNFQKSALLKITSYMAIS
jgi:hypothetical protein